MHLLKRHCKWLQAAAVTQSLLMLAAFSSTSAVSAAVDKDNSASRFHSAKDILQLVLQAYGGAAKLKEHHDRGMRSHATINSISGISSAENSYECDIIEKADKVRVEMTILGTPLIIAYDGKTSWQQNGDWIAPATATSTQQIADELKHGLAALTEALNPKAVWQLLPKHLVQGKMCDGIKLVLDGRTTTFFADPQTHLIVRAEYQGTDQELGLNSLQSIEYDDYRPVAGTVEPFKVIHSIGNRKKTETLTKSIDTNQAINDQTFAMPPESEVARLKDGPQVVPFEYSGNEIIVTARLNGKDCKFIVDTGASQSVLDNAAAANLGSRPLSTFSITAGSQAVPLSYTTVPSLTIGDITFDNIPMLVTDLSHLGEKPSGLIGANILRRFLVTINYDDKTLTLADPRTARVTDSALTVPTKPVFGGTALIVEGRFDDKASINFLVDTGASFNNLPLSLAKLLHNGPVMPVGVISGIDGKRMSIGSLKVKTLRLANVKVSSPVFTVAPDRNPAHNGLFTSSAMGILGNPIWSQFKTTIDYRNEQLILEPRPGQEKFQSMLEQLENADNEYLRAKNTDEALKVFESILTRAKTVDQKAIVALAMSRIANCYADKYARTKESKWLELAAIEFEQASEVANETRLRGIEGQVLAQWALMYLSAPRNMGDTGTAQELLGKALQKAPLEPSLYAAFGIAMLRVGKTPEAEKLLDRALVLDPANWSALWAKYKLYREQKKTKEMSLVAEQLSHYYPGFPDVVAIAPGSASSLVTVKDDKSKLLPGKNWNINNPVHWPKTGP